MSNKIDLHFLYVLLAAAFWGTAGLFVRTVETQIREMQIVFWRTAISALVFGIIILFKDRFLFKIKLRDLWLFICAGLFSIVLFNFSYYTTMSLTSLSVAAVLLYTAPFFVVIISLFLFGEKLTFNKSIACIIAFIGCCFVTGLFDSSQKISNKAIFFGLLTGFGYALYTIFGELLIRRGYKTLTITFYIFLCAVVCTLPFINISQTVSCVVTSPEIFTVVFFMAVFNTVLPYILYTAGLNGVEPSMAPIIATVEPVVATLIGCVVYREAISYLGIFGILLVLSSVVILNLKYVRVTANAKINLTLGIAGKRDDGYHLIDTVMQSVALSDTVTVIPSKKLTVSCKKIKLREKDNIAYKAADLFFSKTGITRGAKIKIRKRIPEAAGMGGGSADAAAVLVALDKLYKTDLSVKELEDMASGLGADVPFFIKGGTQRAQGVGDVLTPITCFNKGCFVLAKEGRKPSTAEMYRLADNENCPLPDTEALIEAIEKGNVEKALKLFGNSFVCVWKNSALPGKIFETGAEAVSLSGSGPIWFGYFSDKKYARKAYKKLKSERIECYIARPCDFALKCE